ncbi:tRNA-wybutosine modification methyltransferase TYW3 [Thermoproteus tenax]|uniref:tRNA(Phe) 7-((3-amino-3-carboxypropyl)-4-demethylwyosine(37)-N(4))-methyltransferase n=1 Tax=Thermoproteus tenax (strain ATCC 35583 / DSM 2078 / JCM 9277 / NBRC 100435 / Kra 1) TaxID=768679 RepID=G4RP63_THETK|nr:hypothetical protein [Thermoproteus tenax]CCC81358.1 Wybutosine (yW) biosynthesis enzyme [Thermoproteus tenax Kra 1]
MIDESAFASRKRAFLDRMRREAEQGRVDPDIYPFLERMNELPWLYTTSSCSGRILLASARTPSYSKGRGFTPIAKWHRAVAPDEILKAAEGHDDVWMLVRGAILHVVVSSAGRARELIELAHETGHKHSGIISVNRAGIVVEILGEERLDIPLKIGGVYKIDVETAADYANRVLLLAKARLAWFIGEFEARYLGNKAPDAKAVREKLRELAKCLWEI